jgi:hypothetical protein
MIGTTYYFIYVPLKSDVLATLQAIAAIVNGQTIKKTTQIGRRGICWYSVNLDLRSKAFLICHSS